MKVWQRFLLLVSLSFSLATASWAVDLSGFIELKPNTTFSGQLEEKQPLRFFFTLTSKQEIVLESHTSQKRHNQVYPSAVLFTKEGRVLARDWSSGVGRNFKIKRQLEAGTYVLRVEDERGCGSLHGCPEILRDFELSFEVAEISPF